MDVVRIVKRITGERKVGHAGTLDPIATGVLPICFGQATRVMDFVIEGTKGYRAEVVLGVATDTFDATGKPLSTQDPSFVSEAQVQETLKSFRGEIEQVPPMYSALKKGGERLYDLARAGMTTPLAPRKVRVMRLELLEWDPPSLILEIECGRGVYIRSLANDFGQILGCGAHLKGLVRFRAGPFDMEGAIGLPQVEQAVDEGWWQELLYPPDYVLGHLNAAVVLDPMEKALAQGQQVPLATALRGTLSHGELCRVFSHDGRFLALVRYDKSRGVWQPFKVFAGLHSLGGAVA